ncbi:DUF1934 domain-containing protein [Paenibacillus lemnae]|uniref:DUF1934 domain-containing protein n=1 Tax=Paenibacillus lemnae TaxID=1330551 RepID=A0A848MCV8_PAELE|nr:DUF1934 domain-containing protein [Paenibacillus lemnae]NMO97913.1 DUF1934 domain-containing protein [Paenibacillus lemnae]
MPDRKQTTIILHSMHGGENTVHELPAEVFAKGEALYVRYEEPRMGPHQGSTRATVKLSMDEVKILRHGEVQSEQAFRLGQNMPGFYRSPFTSFQLSTHTQRMHVDLHGMSGSASWEYDLYVFEDCTGHFSISLTIQEAQET